MFALNASPVMAPVATNPPPHFATAQLSVAHIPTLMHVAAPPASHLLSAVNQRQTNTPSASPTAPPVVTPESVAVASAAGLQLARNSRIEFGFSSPFLAQLLSQDIPGDNAAIQGFFQPLQPPNTAAAPPSFAEVKYLPSLASKPAPEPVMQPVLPAETAPSTAAQLQQNLRLMSAPVMPSATGNSPVAHFSTVQTASFLQTPVLGNYTSAPAKKPLTTGTAPLSLRNKTGVAAYQSTIARTQQLVSRAKEDIPLVTAVKGNSEPPVEAMASVVQNTTTS